MHLAAGSRSIKMIVLAYDFIVYQNLSALIQINAIYFKIADLSGTFSFLSGRSLPVTSCQLAVTSCQSPVADIQ